MDPSGKKVDEQPDEALADRFLETLKDKVRFVVCRCSFCDYPSGWFFRHGRLAFDPGCHCALTLPVTCTRSDLLDWVFHGLGSIEQLRRFIDDPDYFGE